MRSIASSAVCLVFLSLGCDKIRLPTEPSQCATDVGMPGQITGTVLSDSGSPVSDAHVTLSGTSTTSDGAGRFSLDAPSGPATLEIDAPGYVPAQGNIVVTAGTGAIRAVLPRGYGSVIVLFGRVLESCSGSPIAGARVGVPGGFATSASDGTYVLFGVGAGTTHNFRVERKGYKTINIASFRLFRTASSRDFIMDRN